MNLEKGELIHSLIHSFIHQMFIEHLLCAGYCAGPWGDREGQTKISHGTDIPHATDLYADKKQVNV